MLAVGESQGSKRIPKQQTNRKAATESQSSNRIATESQRGKRIAKQQKKRKAANASQSSNQNFD